MNISRTLLAILLAIPIVFAVNAYGQDNDGHTKEQLLVFGTKHLKNIDSASSLLYEFRQDGAQTETLEDTVKLTVSEIHPDASKTLQVKFLSGENERVFPEIEKFSSNPLIMYFLQWDVEKMSDETGTDWRYFQQVIRFGFRKAQSRETTVSYKQNSYKGYQVFFTPLQDENPDKYEKYLNKRYEFTFADDMPGTIYSIKTWIPDTKNKSNIEQTEIKFKELQNLPRKTQ